MKRRSFLQTGAAATAFLAMRPYGNAFGQKTVVNAFAQSNSLLKFMQPLRGNTLGSLVTDIGVAAPDPHLRQ